MDCIDQQQQQQQLPVSKHYCKVCKKGFMCGRALGGHMRAHGIGDESANMDDEDDDEDDRMSDWEEDKVGGIENTSNKRIYKLRTNPNRLKSVRVCENCGQEFFSWKSFLEHGKCGSDDGDSLVSSPGSDVDESFGRRGHGWSKRKRSLRAKVENSINTPVGPDYLSGEDEDLIFAKCLIDLANTRVYSPLTVVAEAAESSCASASKEEERRNLAGKVQFLAPPPHKPNNNNKSNSTKGLFECKACKKVFTSHQALGGHRASHKKVKGCYAAKQDLQDNDSLGPDDDVITHEDFSPSKSSSYKFEKDPTYAEASRRKSKVHECSICHRVFSTGQALGGHKRCHWITSNAYTHDTPAITKFHFLNHNVQNKTSEVGLDLNLPAQGDHRAEPTNRMSLEVSTEIHLHPWYTHTNTNRVTTKDYNNSNNHKEISNNNNNNNNNNKNVVVIENKGGIITQNVDEDEANSKLKFARISGLKETSTSKGGDSSQWLQVGIGSATTTEVGIIDS